MKPYTVRFLSVVLATFCLAPSVMAGAPESAPAPASIPTASEQQKALVTVRDIYKADYARADPAARSALARRLLSDGLAERFDTAARYVLLQQASDLAVQAGDAATAVKSAEALSERFTGFDALASRIKSLHEAVASRAGAAHAAEAATLAIDLAMAAVAADRFDLAEQSASAAESAATKAGKVALVTATREKLGAFRAIQTEYKATLAARETLKSRPGDAPANTRLGKFHAFFRNDWLAALPLLAKGEDAALKALAEKELSTTPDVALALQLADGWWDLAATHKGLPRLSAGRHACTWYRKALPDLAGHTKTRVEARLKAGFPGTAETQASKLDLLTLIDPDRDAIAGAWKIASGALACGRDAYARLEIPLQPPDEYDLRVTFARSEGDGPVTLLLAGPGGVPFGFTMDIGDKARLETVNGKVSTDNPTLTKFKLTNDKRFTALVQIRRDSIRALVDEKPLVEHKTDYKDLARYKPWKLKDDTLLGLGANGGKVAFFKVELTVVSGEYKRVR